MSNSLVLDENKEEENRVFGQYVDIFYDFERAKNWDNYFSSDNIKIKA